MALLTGCSKEANELADALKLPAKTRRFVLTVDVHEAVTLTADYYLDEAEVRTLTRVLTDKGWQVVEGE